MRTVLALALSLALSACATLDPNPGTIEPTPGPLALPFETLAVISQSGALVGSGTCPSGAEGVAFAVEVNGVPYMIFLAPGPGRFVLADQRDGDETPVWYGVVESGQLIVRERLTYRETLDLDRTPCSWLDAATPIRL